MEILGAGLSRTGTKSLTRALDILGFTTIHNDRKRLNPVSPPAICLYSSQAAEAALSPAPQAINRRYTLKKFIVI